MRPVVFFLACFLPSFAVAQTAMVADHGGDAVTVAVAFEGRIIVFEEVTVIRFTEPTPVGIPISDAVAKITPGDQREWLSYLASPKLDGRRPNREGYGLAVDYIEGKCHSWGLKTIRQRVPDRDENLMAYIPGVGPDADEIVVVGAHLDHFGGGKLGADDNASGSTAVMSIAYALSLVKPGPRTVLLQWYTAEEAGLIGSGYYVRNPLFPLGNPAIRQHVAMVNLDMVGRLSSRWNAQEEVEQLEQTAEFSQYIRELKPRYPFADNITITSGNRSDHARFRGAGVSAVWMFTGSHNDYHSKSDTADKINYDGLTSVARYTAELTHRLIHEGHASSVPPAFVDESKLVNVGGEPFHDEE